MKLQINVTNDADSPYVLTLEPWGDECTVTRTHPVTVMVDAPSTPTIEIERSATGLMLAVLNPPGSGAEIIEHDATGELEP